MAVAAIRTVSNVFTGDITAEVSSAAATNTSSPGKIDIVTLSSGANTITPPSSARACTIIPPSSNTTLITLKGVAGDTGIVLHLTDPTSIAINSASSTFVLSAAAQLAGVRLIWS